MLKGTNDGLSKAWKATPCHQPFYDGGKVQVSINQQILASLFNENVTFIDWQKGDLFFTLLDISEDENEESTNEVISSFALHPQATHIAIATQHNLLQLWEINFEEGATKKKERLRSIRGHSMPVLSMCFDPTGALVATGSADCSVRVWDLFNGYCTHSFRDLHKDIVQRVFFHPTADELVVYSTSDDCSVRAFDLRQQKCVSHYKDHMSLPTCVSISPDGRLLVSGGRDKVLNFYDIQLNAHIKTVLVMESIEGASFVRFGKRKEPKDKTAAVTYNLVVATALGNLIVYSVHLSAVQDNKYNFRCDSYLRVPINKISAATAEGSDSLSIANTITSLHLASPDRLLVTTADNALCEFAIAHKADEISLEPNRQFVGSFDDILDIGYVPKAVKDSSFLLAIVSNSPHVRLLDNRFNCHSTLYGHTDIVLAVDVSPTGDWIATTAKDFTVRIWRTDDGKNVAIGKGHTDSVGAVCFSKRSSDYGQHSKSAFLCSGAGDKILKKWSVPVLVLSSVAADKDGEEGPSVPLGCTQSIRAHDKDINTIAISPNDTIIASGSQDKTIKLWRSSDLTAMATLTGHRRGVWRVLFSPVDKSLASCSGDRTVKLWSVTDFSCLRTFEGHTGSVLSLKFVNRGLQLVSGSADGLIRLWTIRTGECEKILDGHTDKVWALSISPQSVMQMSSGGQSAEAIATSVADEPTAGSSAVADVSPVGETELVPMSFFSGGSDSRLNIWVDVTAEEEQTRMSALEKDLLLEQELQNDVRHKRYDKALSIALKIGHSNRVLSILQSIIEDDDFAKAGQTVTIFPTIGNPLADMETNREASSIAERVDTFTAKWTDEEIEKVIGLLKDWNTNAKHSFICTIVLNSLLRVVGVNRLSAIRTVAASLDGLIAYSERHYQRASRLLQSTYIVDYFSSLMNWLPEDRSSSISLEGRESKACGADANAKKRVRPDGVKAVLPAPVLFAASSSNKDDEDDDGNAVEDSKQKKKAKKSKKGATTAAAEL